MKDIIAELIDEGYSDEEIADAVVFDLGNKSKSKDVSLTDTYGKTQITALKVKNSVIKEITGKEICGNAVKYSVHINDTKSKNKINFAVKIDKAGDNSARKDRQNKPFHPDDYTTLFLTDVKKAINKKHKDLSHLLFWFLNSSSKIYTLFEYDDNFKYEIKDNVIYVEVKYKLEDYEAERLKKFKELKKGDSMEYCDGCLEEFPKSKLTEIENHSFCKECKKDYI